MSDDCKVGGDQLEQVNSVNPENVERYDMDEKEVHRRGLKQWGDLRTKIIMATAKQSKQFHWLPRWRRGILRLLEQTKMGFCGKCIFTAPADHPIRSFAPKEPPENSLYIIYFPLQNGKVFPLEIRFKSYGQVNKEYVDAIVNLRNRLYVENSRAGRGIRDLPVNLWFSFLRIVYRSLHSTFDGELLEKIEQVLITTHNWIRVPYTSYHIDVPLTIGGNLVKRSDKQSNVNNLCWVKHPMQLSKPGDEDYDYYHLFNNREKCGIEPIYNGNLHLALSTTNTINLYSEQVIRLLNLCFRHDAYKKELVCAFAKQVFYEQVEQTSLPITIDEEKDEGSVRYRVEEFLRPLTQSQLPMQFWFGDSDSPENYWIANNPNNNFDEIRDTILLLSDAAYYKGLRRKSYLGEDEWLTAAVIVAKRVAEYKKHLTQLDVAVGTKLLSPLTNIVGHYFLLHVQLPSPPHVKPAKITVAEWGLVD